MVDVVGNAQLKLSTLVSNHYQTKTPQENGRSAFWRWFDTIKRYTLEIESLPRHYPYNGHYILQMGVWGYVEYDIVIVDGNVVFYVFDYLFNEENFKKWINHETIDSPIISSAFTSVTSSGINGIEIVKSDANTYNWRNIKTGQILSKKWYLQIGKFNSQGITYVQLKDNVFRFINSSFKYTDNNPYQCIGTTPKGNFYVQLQNGYYCLLNPECTRKDNNLWQDVVQQNGVFKGFNGRVWNVAENRRLNQIITETLNRVIRESILKENLKKKNPCH